MSDNKQTPLSEEKLKKEDKKYTLFNRFNNFCKKAHLSTFLIWGAVTFILLNFILWAFTSLDIYTLNQNTAFVGDTIGGITAPFLNFIAAFLVYRSLMAQVEANRALNDRMDKQDEQARKNKEESDQDKNYSIIFDNFKLLKEDFSQFRYEQYVSKDAMLAFSHQLSLIKSKSDLSSFMLQTKNASPQQNLTIVLAHLQLLLLTVNTLRVNPKLKLVLFVYIDSFYQSNLKYSLKIMAKTFVLFDDFKDFRMQINNIELILLELNNRLKQDEEAKLHKATSHATTTPRSS